MHGTGLCTESALEALGVDIDNGLSHMQDVKAIVQTGARVLALTAPGRIRCRRMREVSA